MIPLYDDQPTSRFPFVTILLIVVNALVFTQWQLHTGLEESVQLAGLIPARITRAFTEHEFASIFTSMFMHAGWMHLIGNMWFLWVFGKKVEDDSGPFRFLYFYLICGVAADAAYVAFAPKSPLPLVGASGAISGVLGAYLLLNPGGRIMTFVPILAFIRIVRVPAWIFLLAWFGMQILAQIGPEGRPGGGGVAYFAHIGGFIVGVCLISFFKTSYED